MCMSALRHQLFNRVYNLTTHLYCVACKTGFKKCYNQSSNQASSHFNCMEAPLWNKGASKNGLFSSMINFSHLKYGCISLLNFKLEDFECLFFRDIEYWAQTCLIFSLMGFVNLGFFILDISTSSFSIPLSSRSEFTRQTKSFFTGKYFWESVSNGPLLMGSLYANADEQMIIPYVQ